jgi:hypothetical protein
LVFEAGFAAVYVSVLDAEHHRPALLPRKKPVEESGASITNVEMSGGRGSKADANRRI